MLRYGYRFSKDIDIFVPDPQSLGFVTPRLSDVAESITSRLFRQTYSAIQYGNGWSGTSDG